MPSEGRHTEKMDRELTAEELKEMGYSMPSEKCTSRYSVGGTRFECQLEFGHRGDHRWGVAWSEKEAADQLRTPGTKAGD